MHGHNDRKNITYLFLRVWFQVDGFGLQNKGQHNFFVEWLTVDLICAHNLLHANWGGKHEDLH